MKKRFTEAQIVGFLREVDAEIPVKDLCRTHGFSWVDDVDAVHQRCLEQGLDVTWPPTNMPWNVREMHVRHPDGHVFRISRGTEEA